MAAGTVTYRYPAAVKGTTTAPTTAQVVNSVVADVAMADASTVTTITHNLGVSTDGSDGSPNVSVFCAVGGTAPCVPIIAFTTNAITLTQSTTAAGSGSTWRVIITRPWSGSQ